MQRPRLSSKNMPPSLGVRAIGRAGGLYENSEVVFVDYLAPLDKSLSRPLPLKNWRPPWRPSRRGRLVAQTAWRMTYSNTFHWTSKKNFCLSWTRAGLRDGANMPGEQRRLSRFWEKERPTSCEQLSPYCSYVHLREIAWATHCESPFLVVGGEVAPQPVASRVPQAPMYHRPMPQIVLVRLRWPSVEK